MTFAGGGAGKTLPSDFAHFTDKTKDWDSFTPQSQHCQEADHAVFLELAHLESKGLDAGDRALKLWRADCFITGCVYAVVNPAPEGTSISVIKPFLILDKLVNVLLVLPLKRLGQTAVFVDLLTCSL